MEEEQWQLSPLITRPGLTWPGLIDCWSQCCTDNEGSGGDLTYLLEPVLCSGKYDGDGDGDDSHVNDHLLSNWWEIHNDSQARDDYLPDVTPKIFSRKSCETNILLIFTFKIFSFHFALGSFQKYPGVLSWW